MKSGKEIYHQSKQLVEAAFFHHSATITPGKRFLSVSWPYQNPLSSDSKRGPTAALTLFIRIGKHKTGGKCILLIIKSQTDQGLFV